MNFDTTINLSDLLVIGGGVIAFLKIWLKVRDVLRDVQLVLGSIGPPPSGLVGEVHAMRRELGTHREWMIRAGIDQVGPRDLS